MFAPLMRLLILTSLLLPFIGARVYGQTGYKTVKTFSVGNNTYSDLYSALSTAVPQHADITIKTTYVPYQILPTSNSESITDKEVEAVVLSDLDEGNMTVSEASATGTVSSLLPEPDYEVIHSSYFSGEIYASSISFHYMNNFMMLQTAMNHFRDVDLMAYNGTQQQPSNSGGQNTGTPYGAGYGTGGYDTAPYGPGYAPMYEDPSMGGYNGAPMESVINRGQQQVNYGDPGTLIYSGWLTGFWGDGNIKERGGEAGYDTDRAGGMIGLDLFGCTDCRSGLFYAYQQNKLKGKTDSYGHAKTEQHLIGLYHHFGDEVIYNILTVRGQYSRYDTTRKISSYNINENFLSKTDYYDGAVNYERGMHFRFGDAFDIAPYAGIDFDYLNRGAIHENGSGPDSGYALKGSSKSYYSLRSELGARLSLNMFPGTQQLKIVVNGNWSHEFLDDINGKTHFSYVGNSNASYYLTGNSLGRDWGLIGGGIDWIPVPALVIFANYDYVKNKYVSFNNAYLGARVRW